MPLKRERELRKLCERNGYEVIEMYITGGCHYKAKLRKDDVDFVTVFSLTPGDARSNRNAFRPGCLFRKKERA